MAALGEPSEEGVKAELPLVTLVFCAVNGLKAMRVSLSAVRVKGLPLCFWHWFLPETVSVRPTCVPSDGQLAQR